MDLPERIVWGYSQYVIEEARKEWEEKAALHIIASLFIGILIGMSIGVLLCNFDKFSSVIGYVGTVINNIHFP